MTGTIYLQTFIQVNLFSVSCTIITSGTPKNAIFIFHVDVTGTYSARPHENILLETSWTVPGDWSPKKKKKRKKERRKKKKRKRRIFFRATDCAYFFTSRRSLEVYACCICHK